MDFTYIIYGENIYYLDENNVIFSIEGFHGVVREGFNKSSFIKPILALNNNSFIEGVTPEEIAEANKPKVPEEIAKMHLKIELIKRGIECQEVEDTINAIPSEMFSEIDKKIAITKFNDAVSFDRYNADLQLVATLMGLTQEDLDEIFINGNLLR